LLIAAREELDGALGGRGAELGSAARALHDFLGYTFNAAGQSLAG
jgi:hypothetical protein